MLTVSKNSISEPIGDYVDLCIEEEINGVYVLAFKALNSEVNEHSYPLLENESLVDFGGHEFRVKNLISGELTKSVEAIHTFFDLVGTQKHDTYGGTRTPEQIFNWLYGGTGWTVEIVDSIPATLLPGFGRGNVIQLTREACKAFDCEIELAKNKHIRVHKRLGEDNDFQFRYGYNIKTFSHEVDTSNLRTSIKGYGNGIEVEYVSPNKSKFPSAGEADSVYDDRYTIAENLLERVKQELNDAPAISIEIAELDLGEVKKLGDVVWLIYEPLDIELASRIVARKTYPKAPHKNTVTLGTVNKKSMSDNLTEQNIQIEENARQVQSKFEQTNDRITLEVEEIGGAITGIEFTVGQIESYVSGEIERMDGDIETANSRITQTANTIRSEVNSEITRLDGRVNSANSSITQLSNRIETKVSETDYNGQTLVSMIEQTPSYIRLTANKIEFAGHVFGSNATFTGTLRGGRVEGSSIWIDAGAPDFLYSNAMDTNPNTQGTHVYVRPTANGEARATVTGTTGNYRPFRAKEFITDTSLRENKRNIDVYDLDVLETFRKAEVYLYNRTNEGSYTKKQLGLMIDEMPYEVISERGDSLGLYSLVSFLFRGIKQLVKEIDEIKGGEKTD